MAAKMGYQYKSMQQNIKFSSYLKDFGSVVVPHVKAAELITCLGDAKLEECLCCELQRHFAAL